MASGHTEELLGTALLDDLDDAGLELLNGGNVVGEDTHLTRLGGDVDLDDVLRLVDGLIAAISMEGVSTRINSRMGGGHGSSIESQRIRGWLGRLAGSVRTVHTW